MAVNLLCSQVSLWRLRAQYTVPANTTKTESFVDVSDVYVTLVDDVCGPEEKRVVYSMVTAAAGHDLRDVDAIASSLIKQPRADSSNGDRCVRVGRSIAEALQADGLWVVRAPPGGLRLARALSATCGAWR